MTLLGEMLVADGERKGELIKLISLIRKKLHRGFEPEEISELLEEELPVVQKICDILKQEKFELSDEDVYRRYTKQEN